jgi:hypothetical protein
VHYLLRDALELLLGSPEEGNWGWLCAPARADFNLASSVLTMLVRVSPHPANTVFKDNIRLVKDMLEQWTPAGQHMGGGGGGGAAGSPPELSQPGLEVDKQTLLVMLRAGDEADRIGPTAKGATGNALMAKSQRDMLYRSRQAALQVIAAVLANGLPLYDPLLDSATDQAALHKALAAGLRTLSKAQREATAEQRHEGGGGGGGGGGAEADRAYASMLASVQEPLRALHKAGGQGKGVGEWVQCLEACVRHFPPLLDKQQLRWLANALPSLMQVTAL